VTWTVAEYQTQPNWRPKLFVSGHLNDRVYVEYRKYVQDNAKATLDLINITMYTDLLLWELIKRKP
jgi:hypothetical protein